MSRRWSRFKNKKTGGYDSKKESLRAADLRLLEKLGEISELREQVKYELLPRKVGKYKTERAVSYIADFVYVNGGETIVEDSKSPVTKKLPEYIIKRKLMLAVYGISILET